MVIFGLYTCKFFQKYMKFWVFNIMEMHKKCFTCFQQRNLLKFFCIFIHTVLSKSGPFIFPMILFKIAYDFSQNYVK